MALNRQKIINCVLAGLFLAAVLIWTALFQSGQFAAIGNSLPGQDRTKIVFFDVGQGSATFIEAPNGNQMLVDGGPSSLILNRLGGVMPFFDRQIDVIVLTHPDADHLNGLVDVLRRYEVAQVIDPCMAEPGANYQEFLRLIEEKEISHFCAKAGQRIKLAEDVAADVLCPFESLEGISLKNTNDASIVLKMEYGQNRVLLTGDAEKKTEYQLIQSNIDLRAQILQVGHHGSKTSTSEEFVSAVSPETAVIQAGKDNRYGHPHQEVLGRLAGVKIFRTDLDGDVEFLCDREECAIR